MSYPGEQHAYWTLYSSLTSPTEKAKASVKLAEIDQIRRHNEQVQYDWDHGGSERYYNSLNK